MNSHAAQPQSPQSKIIHDKMLGAPQLHFHRSRHLSLSGEAREFFDAQTTDFHCPRKQASSQMKHVFYLCKFKDQLRKFFNLDLCKSVKSADEEGDIS
jgi:hypothetical protein